MADSMLADRAHAADRLHQRHTCCGLHHVHWLYRLAHAESPTLHPWALLDSPTSDHQAFRCSCGTLAFPVTSSQLLLLFRYLAGTLPSFKTRPVSLSFVGWGISRRLQEMAGGRISEPRLVGFSRLGRALVVCSYASALFSLEGSVCGQRNLLWNKKRESG